MLRSIMAAFSDPEDFGCALRREGCLNLVITGIGRFQARLTQVALEIVDLTAAEEQLSRVVFFGAPADVVLLIFPIGYGTSPLYGGIGLRAGEIMTVGPGVHTHSRVDGIAHWATVHLPVDELIKYGVSLTGAPFTVPPAIQRWQPRRSAIRNLRSLHAAAIRMASVHPQTLMDPEAAHGLEQQVIHAVVECLPGSIIDPGSAKKRREQDTMVGFEQLLQNQSDRSVRLTEICLALDVSERSLRRLCVDHLGMSPITYDRLRRMSLVHRALHFGATPREGVAELARRYGFRDPGRFAADYRTIFGELPSATYDRMSNRQQSAGNCNAATSTNDASPLVPNFCRNCIARLFGSQACSACRRMQQPSAALLLR